MNYRETNVKLELLRNALACATLAGMMFSSCVSVRRCDDVLSKVSELEKVVHEYEATCCPVSNPIEEDK